MKIANRGAEIAPFYAMEVLKAANDRAAAGDDVLHMEVGGAGRRFSAPGPSRRQRRPCGPRGSDIRKRLEIRPLRESDTLH